MPLVERICECGARWEDLVGMVSEADRLNCPVCQATSQRTAPGSFMLNVCGIEKMTPGEIQLGFENKRDIERQADRLHSGAISVKQKSTVPVEMRPVIPKRFH